MKNKLIFDFFDIIDKLQIKTNCQYDENNKYRSIIIECKKIAKEQQIDLNILRVEIEEFIKNMNINNLKHIIGKFIYFNDIEEELSEQENNHLIIPLKELNDLNDNKLLLFFFRLIETVTYTQHSTFKNLVLLKYNKSIWVTGFNDYTNVCRGKIFDTKSRKIIGYGWDKFFNVNENPFTHEDVVKEKLEKCTYKCLSDKKDGSTIIISPTSCYGTLISTNGSFISSQVNKAKEFLRTKYSKFEKNLYKFNNNYSFIFEIVYPENKIVLDYGKKEELILIGVRDLKTYNLLTYEEMFNISKIYELPITEKEPFDDVANLLKLSKELLNTNKEGWVLRIDTKDEQFFCKIKLDEYFKMHKTLFCNISLKYIYNLYIEDTVDDILPLLNDEIKKQVQDKLIYITSVLLDFKNLMEQEIDIIQNKIKFSPKELLLIKETRKQPEFAIFLEVVKELSKINSIKGTILISYFLKNKSLDEIIQNFNYTKFKEIEKYLETTKS